MNLLIDLAFWCLLAAVVFAGCYWTSSELGWFLIRVAPGLTPAVRAMAWSSTCLMTLVALAGIARWLTRR